MSSCKSLGYTMRILRLSILVLSSSLLLQSCMFSKQPDSLNLSDLRQLNATANKALDISDIRFVMLRDAALSVGARSGLAFRSNQINYMLARHERLLDRVFNFNALVLDNNVMPPVLLEGRNTLEQTSANTLRLADRTYSIYKQAYFVTNPVTWRNYLWLPFEKPELPDRSLLPKQGSEQQIWEKYVTLGWEAGMVQADTIYQENLGRIKRDFVGMLLYRKLLAQNIVTAPFVAKMELGITGGGSDMTVNDRVLRITALPSLTPHGKHWNSKVIAKEERR